MDLLRGSAILLVVTLHAAEILSTFQLSVPEGISAANRFFSPFRMPTLMFLSGLLLSRSLDKPLKAYYLGKVNLIAWPYIVWCFIYLSISGDFRALLQPASWIATGYLWYIFFLGCYYFAAPWICRLPGHILSLTALLISIPIEAGMIKYFFYFACFFFAGHAASQHEEFLAKLLTRRIISIAFVVASAFGLYAMFNGYRWEGEYALFSFAGILCLMYAAQHFQDRAFTRPLRYVGLHSMIFYTSHFPVLLLTTHLLSQYRLIPGWLVVSVGVAVALAVATCLCRARELRPVSLLFRGPLGRQPSTSRLT